MQQASQALGEILHHLQLSGVLYCKSELRGSWGMSLPSVPQTSMFHILISGSCLLEHKGQSLEMKAGDFVFVPQGEGQILKSDPEAQVVDLFDLPCHQISEYYETLTLGTEGEPTRALCGVMRLEHPSAQYFIQAMPDLIHIDVQSTGYMDWLGHTIKLIADEAERPQIGGETLLTRLADVLVIQALRHWICESEAQEGWLRALNDERIGQALSLIHNHPEYHWTLQNLAETVGMSRSTFATAFKNLVGEPMLQYLTRWRMNLGLMRLRRGEKLNLDLVEALGYSSEAAFRRAFKKAMGKTIGAYLKEDTFQANLALASQTRST